MNTSLTINKTLHVNLPKQVNEPELHFTEDGGIYLSKNDGTLVKVGVDEETKNEITTLEGEVSTLKSNFDEVKQSVSNGKELIATAITGKGINASGNESFSDLAAKIEGIQSSEGGAVGGLNYGESVLARYDENLKANDIVFLKQALNDGNLTSPEGREKFSQTLTNYVTNAVFSPNGKMVILHMLTSLTVKMPFIGFYYNEEFSIWRPIEVNYIETTFNLTKDLTSVNFSNDGSHLILTSSPLSSVASKAIALFKVGTDSITEVFCENGYTCTHAAIHPSNKYFITCIRMDSASSSKNEIRLYKYNEELDEYTFELITTGAKKPIFTPDGRYISLLPSTTTSTPQISYNFDEVTGEYYSTSDLFDITPLFPNGGTIIKYSQKGDYLVFVNSASPYFALYFYENGSFTKLPRPDDAGGATYGVDIAYDSSYVITSRAKGAEGIKLYELSGLNLTSLDNRKTGLDEIIDGILASTSASVKGIGLSKNNIFASCSTEGSGGYANMFRITDNTSEYVVSKSRLTDTNQLAYIETTNYKNTLNVVRRLN